MWPQNFLKILVPRTPPDPPLPPLTPPRGPGGPKMAKMHSLKSIDDNLCQKSHFWGVKKIDLFFHSEYTLCERRWMVRQGEGNNLLVEWTHKALCEGTTSRLAIGTCRHLESYHKVLPEGGENYLEEELHKNKSLEGWLWSHGRAV